MIKLEDCIIYKKSLIEIKQVFSNISNEFKLAFTLLTMIRWSRKQTLQTLLVNLKERSSKCFRIEVMNFLALTLLMMPFGRPWCQIYYLFLIGCLHMYILQTRVKHNIAHVSNFSIVYSESASTKQNIANDIIDFHD